MLTMYCRGDGPTKYDTVHNSEMPNATAICPRYYAGYDPESHPHSTSVIPSYTATIPIHNKLYEICLRRSTHLSRGE
jgi:hypothetical protein